MAIGTTQCPHCRARIPLGSAFCLSCGRQIGQARQAPSSTGGPAPIHSPAGTSLTPCIHCKQPVSTWAVACPHCGCPLGDDPPGNWLTILGGTAVLLSSIGPLIGFLLAMAIGVGSPSAVGEPASQNITLQGLVLGGILWIVGTLRLLRR